MSAFIILAFVFAAADTRPISAGMEVPNAIVRQHNSYVLCQDDHFDLSRVSDQKSFGAEVEKAITACRYRKATLTQEAQKVLASAPDYTDQVKRQRALCEAFDSYDEMRRAMARGSQTYKAVCR